MTDISSEYFMIIKAGQIVTNSLTIGLADIQFAHPHVIQMKNSESTHETRYIAGK